MEESLKLVMELPVKAKTIYDSWLDSKAHSEFTGSKAIIDPHKGGIFTAGNNYIKGKTLELQPYGRIVQSWRTNDFPSYCKDSIVEILLEKSKEGTRFTLLHSGIPEGQAEKYKKGWEENYFKPLKKYFNN